MKEIKIQIATSYSPGTFCDHERYDLMDSIKHNRILFVSPFLFSAATMGEKAQPHNLTQH